MADSWRLFVGITLDELWTARLDAVADGLRELCGRWVRWVRPELYHVTVVFLGNQTPDRAETIQQALASACAGVEPFPLRLLELKRLGGHERGAIVAAVHDPSGQLQALRMALNGELRQRGISFDAKPLVPHITLGRPRHGAPRFEIPRTNLGNSGSLHVSGVSLIKSNLLPTGSRYESIFTAPLASSS